MQPTNGNPAHSDGSKKKEFGARIALWAVCSFIHWGAGILAAQEVIQFETARPTARTIAKYETSSAPRTFNLLFIPDAPTDRENYYPTDYDWPDYRHLPKETPNSEGAIPARLDSDLHTPRFFRLVLREKR